MGRVTPFFPVKLVKFRIVEITYFVVNCILNGDTIFIARRGATLSILPPQPSPARNLKNRQLFYSKMPFLSWNCPFCCESASSHCEDAHFMEKVPFLSWKNPFLSSKYANFDVPPLVKTFLRPWLSDILVFNTCLPGIQNCLNNFSCIIDIRRVFITNGKILNAAKGVS